MLSYKKGNLEISINSETGQINLADVKNKVLFKIKESPYTVSQIKINDGVTFRMDAENAEFECKYLINEDETGAFIELIISSDAELQKDIAYPPSIAVEKGMRILDPICNGMGYMTEDDIPIPQRRNFYGGVWVSMCFWGTEKTDKSWLMTTVMTSMDAVMMTQKNKESLYETSVVWEPEKGRWGYSRKIRYYLGKGESVTQMCQIYRIIAQKKGLVKTLAEKSAELPIKDSLAGRANFWVWNNDAMDKLYSENAVYTVPSAKQNQQRRDIAEDMKKNGMDEVLWCIFDENIDAETVEYIKTLGYFTTYYDVYTDVIPGDYAPMITETRRRRCEHRVPYWPEGIIVRSDGSLCPAWDLKGVDGKFYPQNRMCDTVVIDCAKKYITEHGINNGIEGVFIDVSFCDTYECYSEKHPLTRTQAMVEKKKLFGMIKDMNLFCGTENGHEEAVTCCDYNEGMMSPTFFRAYDSGRRMTHIYEEEQMGEKFNKYMLNPKYRIPLWELVFHDCQTSYPYWGDSANSLPSKTEERDLYSVLYGQPPLYSFKADDWERLKEDICKSYFRTVPNARELRGLRMISFEYLTEDMSVQKTVFENSTEIIANFGDVNFEYEKQVIKPKKSFIRRKK